jgi:hypothetical protein
MRMIIKIIKYYFYIIMNFQQPLQQQSLQFPPYRQMTNSNSTKNPMLILVVVLFVVLVLVGVGIAIYYMTRGKKNDDNDSGNTPSPTPTPSPSRNGDIGDTCTQHSNCKTGLGCIDGKCTGQQIDKSNLPAGIQDCADSIQWYLPNNTFKCIYPENTPDDKFPWICKFNNNVYANTHRLEDTDTMYLQATGNDGTPYKFKFNRAFVDGKDNKDHPCSTYNKEPFYNYTIY